MRNSDTHKNYQIYKNPSTGKYGIRNTDMDLTIIECVFDKIELYANSGLVRFTMQGMHAVYNIENLHNLSH